MSPHTRATALSQVEVYLDDSIGITQGISTERRQMTGHLFHTIDKIFRPNNKDDLAREEPISLKKLRKGDAAWSTQDFVLVWAIDTVNQVLSLPADRNTNLLALIDTIPPQC